MKNRIASAFLMMAMLFSLVVPASATGTVYTFAKGDNIQKAVTFEDLPGTGWEKEDLIAEDAYDYYGHLAFEKSGLSSDRWPQFLRVFYTVGNVVGNMERNHKLTFHPHDFMSKAGTPIKGVMCICECKAGTYKVYGVQEDFTAASKVEGCFLTKDSTGYEWHTIKKHQYVGVPKNICHPYKELANGERQWYVLQQDNGSTMFLFDKPKNSERYVGYVETPEATYVLHAKSVEIRVNDPKTGTQNAALSVLLEGTYNAEFKRVDFTNGDSVYLKGRNSKIPYAAFTVIMQGKEQTVYLTKKGLTKI